MSINGSRPVGPKGPSITDSSAPLKNSKFDSQLEETKARISKNTKNPLAIDSTASPVTTDNPKAILDKMNKHIEKGGSKADLVRLALKHFGSSEDMVEWITQKLTEDKKEGGIMGRSPSMKKLG